MRFKHPFVDIRPHIVMSLASAILLTPLATSAAPQSWPERPIKIVVPSQPGGSADAVARLVGDRLARAVRQPVIIENRGGGGGNIAAEAVAKAPADGYTLLYTGNNHPLNIYLFNKVPYKLDDFVAIAEVQRGPSVFVAATNTPFDSLRGLINAAKAKPASIAFGSPGIGLPSHIAFELFERHAGISMIHAPYKGSGPSLADAVGGQIPVVSSTLAAALPQIKAGKLRALAVTSEQRWPSLPEVPTVAEVTGKPFAHLTWLGLLAPKATPSTVVTRLNAEVSKILTEPSVRNTIEAMGTLTVGGTSAAFQRVIDDEAAASKALVQSAGLRAD